MHKVGGGDALELRRSIYQPDLRGARCTPTTYHTNLHDGTQVFSSFLIINREVTNDGTRITPTGRSIYSVVEIRVSSKCKETHKRSRHDQLQSRVIMAWKK